MSDLLYNLRRPNTDLLHHTAADEIKRLNALVESLQNKWATRPLSHPDGEALIAENERLRRELAEAHAKISELRQALSEEMSDEINVKLDEARGLLREAEFELYFWMPDETMVPAGMLKEWNKGVALRQRIDAFLEEKKDAP